MQADLSEDRTGRLVFYAFDILHLDGNDLRPASERQEFVISGYVPSTTSRRAIGSLILGYFEDGNLVHAGRVGTGFTQKTAADLYKRLAKPTQKRIPFAEKLPAEEVRDAVFVRPELVAEVEFRAWTAGGSIRHASFRGLREDRSAEEVVRESDDAVAEKPRPTVRLTHPDRLYWKAKASPSRAWPTVTRMSGRGWDHSW